MQVLAGGHGARTYQDERFSYVVLRRGPRPGPETIPDLTVARQRQVDPPDAIQRAIQAGDCTADLSFPDLPKVTFVSGNCHAVALCCQHCLCTYHALQYPVQPYHQSCQRRKHVMTTIQRKTATSTCNMAATITASHPTDHMLGSKEL